MGKRAFGRHHLRNSGRPRYGDRWVSCTGKPADVDNGGLAAAARVSSEGGCVCVCVHPRAGFGVWLCAWRGGGVFEEMMRVLKILLRGSQTRE